MKRNVLFIVLIALLCGCQRPSQTAIIPQTDSIAVVEVEIKAETTMPAKSELAQRLDSLGFINIAEADSTIRIDLAYTHPNNFTGEILYETLREAYLHPMAMESLMKANRLLKAKHPSYSLLVLDAARMHNYGMAVDATIVDEHGKWLPMGTEFDHFGIEAHITNEEELVKQGKITTQERENRVLLRSIMREAGFIPLYNEWWHFNRLKREETITHYKLIE